LRKGGRIFSWERAGSSADGCADKQVFIRASHGMREVRPFHQWKLASVIAPHTARSMGHMD
jgi:hypothetical protein